MSDKIEIPRAWVDDRREEIADSVEVLEGKIDRIKEEIRELRVEKNILDRWVEMFKDRPSNGARPSGHRIDHAPRRLPKPSKAVDRFFAENPGTNRDEAVERILERGVRSSAQDPRGVVMTAIRRRLSGEDLWESPGGRVWPWKHPEAVQARAELEEEQSDEAQSRFGSQVTDPHPAGGE